MFEAPWTVSHAPWLWHQPIFAPVTIQHTLLYQACLDELNLCANCSACSCILALLLKLVLGEVPMTKVCRRDPRSTLLGLSASAGPAMQPAPAILLICRTLTRGTATCLRTAPLPRPVRPKPPLETDSHVVFCQHGKHPAYEVLLYRKLIAASRRVELSCRGKFRSPRAAKLEILSPEKVSFGKHFLFGACKLLS